MQVFVKTGAIDRHHMAKEVAKPAAFKQLSDIAKREHLKATDPWWKKRTDWVASGKNAKDYGRNLERVSPEALSAATKDRMWRRAKQLKDEFVMGMLSKEEVHPVKGFKDPNGAVKWVVDQEKVNANVQKNVIWNKHNEAKVREFKNLMRHLCPQDPNAGDIERFRPRRKA